MKILICDDEPAVVNHIQNVIKQDFPEAEILMSYSDTEFSEVINSEKHIDLLFADIMLGDKNGIGLAKLAADKYPDIDIVFVSGNTDMMPATLDAGSNVRFIRKPIDDFYIRFHIESTIQRLNSKKEIFVFSLRKKEYSVDLSKLVYIESQRNVVFINLTDETIKATAKISDFEPLPSPKLIRCHQSFVVNIEFVTSVSSSGFTTSTGVTIPISSSRLIESKETYFKYRGGVL